MLNIVRPEYFIPVHGEYRHLMIHGKLAQQLGIPQDKTIIAEDGDVVEFSENEAAIVGKVEAGKVFVDGKGVGDIGDLVLKDRLHLSQDGIVIALAAINEKTGELIYGPDIISSGFVFEKESGEILEKAKEIVLETLDNINVEAKTDWMEAKTEIRKSLRKYFNKVIKRRPVILPFIIEI
jgi:ribonuclease J